MEGIFRSRENANMLWDVFIQSPAGFRLQSEPKNDTMRTFIDHMRTYAPPPELNSLVDINKHFLDNVCRLVFEGSFFHSSINIAPVLRREHTEQINSQTKLHERDLEQYLQRPTPPVVQFTETGDTPVENWNDLVEQENRARMYESHTQPPNTSDNMTSDNMTSNNTTSDKQSENIQYPANKSINSPTSKMDELKTSLDERFRQIEFTLAKLAQQIEQWGRQIDSTSSFVNGTTVPDKEDSSPRPPSSAQSIQ